MSKIEKNGLADNSVLSTHHSVLSVLSPLFLDSRIPLSLLSHNSEFPLSLKAIFSLISGIGCA